ncbi:hypothetical protein U8P68_17195 [Rhizobium ruizarguesonis]|nr:hypothetical protein U8P68_17195 [Rhizobium ruizarguesonis]
MRPGYTRRELHRRKLAKSLASLKEALSNVDTEVGFLKMIWATDMLQSKLGKDVSRYLQYPADAATDSAESVFAVRKWELETLVALYFNIPSVAPLQRSGKRKLNTSTFDAISHMINILRKVEDSESGVRLTPQNVLREMHKIAHRQFEWQRSFSTRERLYRFAYIYGQGGCGEYFQTKYGLSINEFLQAGFLIFAHAHIVPWMQPAGLERLDVTVESVAKTLGIMSLSRQDFRASATELNETLFEGKNLPFPYLPSLLRRYPIIAESRFGSFIAPLPQLIMYRMTVGLFYDIAAGPQALLNEANNRFELYAQRLLQGFFPSFEVMGSKRYGPKRSSIDTPDILVAIENTISIVLECKATKLTYLSQYADEPVQEARKGYEQIAKGIAQLWRFFAHARLGLFNCRPVSPEAVGILLTLDAWLPMSVELQDEVRDIARSLVAKDTDITEADMRRVIFCPMQDLADTAIISTEAQFRQTIARAVEDDFRGWALREIRRKIDQSENPHEFPLDYGDVLPWMKAMTPSDADIGTSISTPTTVASAG